jgi:hypothetical protein
MTTPSANRNTPPPMTAPGAAVLPSDEFPVTAYLSPVVGAGVPISCHWPVHMIAIPVVPAHVLANVRQRWPEIASPWAGTSRPNFRHSATTTGPPHAPCCPLGTAMSSPSTLRTGHSCSAAVRILRDRTKPLSPQRSPASASHPRSTRFSSLTTERGPCLTVSCPARVSSRAIWQLSGWTLWSPRLPPCGTSQHPAPECHPSWTGSVAASSMTTSPTCGQAHRYRAYGRTRNCTEPAGRPRPGPHSRPVSR